MERQHQSFEDIIARSMNLLARSGELLRGSDGLFSCACLTDNRSSHSWHGHLVSMTTLPQRNVSPAFRHPQN
jgi:hypothetical protein